jgi:hypothetical protein
MANFIAAKLRVWRAQFKAEKARFNLPAAHSGPNLRGMFDTIKAELAPAADKLAHLRRFL